MQVSLETTEGLGRRLTITLSKDIILSEIRKRFEHIKRTVQLPGFRPGKVPLELIRKHFGEEIREEVELNFVKTALTKTLTEQELHPVGEPYLERLLPIESPESLEEIRYSLSFEIFPKVTLYPFNEIVINIPEVTIDESDVNAVIEQIRYQNKLFSPVTRPAKLGDKLVIDIKATNSEGKAIETIRKENAIVSLGSGEFPEELENGMMGICINEERTIEVASASNRVDSLKTEGGKSYIRFSVTPKFILEPSIPNMDEQFILKMGIKEGTLTAFQQFVHERMEHDVDKRIYELAKNQVIEALYQHHPLILPKKLVEEETANLRLKQKDNPLFETQMVDIITLAQRRVTLGIVIGEIIRTAHLKASRTQIRDYIRGLVENYEKPDDLEQWYMTDPERLRHAEAMVLEDACVNWILTQVQVNSIPTPFSSLMDPTYQPKTPNANFLNRIMQ